MTRARVIFDTIETAASGLETVLLDARETEKRYFFSGVSATQILKSGLILEGDISDVLTKVSKVIGSVVLDD